MVASGGAREDRIAQVRVDIERKSKDERALAKALEALARVSAESDETRAGMLFEAAELVRSTGDLAGAIARGAGVPERVRIVSPTFAIVPDSPERRQIVLWSIKLKTLLQ